MPLSIAAHLVYTQRQQSGSARMHSRPKLDDIPALSLTPDQAGLLRKGQQLVGIAAPDGQCFAMLGDIPVALAEAKAGSVRVVRGFNL